MGCGLWAVGCGLLAAVSAFASGHDFSLSDLRALNQRSAGQLIADATYVPSPQNQSVDYLDYINTAKRSLNGWIWFQISPTDFALDASSGRYIAPNMAALAQGVYLASAAYFSVTPVGHGAVAHISAPPTPSYVAPQVSSTLFSVAQLADWSRLSASQIMGFLDNETLSNQSQVDTAEETDFLNFFNTKIIALQNKLITEGSTLAEIVTTLNFYGLSTYPNRDATSFSDLRSLYVLVRNEYNYATYF